MAHLALRRRFVLLDRDGTIIHNREYLADPKLVELLPGAAEGLRSMRALGFGLVVVSNQSGVGRGWFDEACVEVVHARLRQILQAEGVLLDGIYYCPHHPDAGCRCRKPRPALVERAVHDLRFDPAESVVIGDSACDLGLGRAIRATTILVRTGHGVQAEETSDADHVVADLCEAAAIVARSSLAHRAA